MDEPEITILTVNYNTSDFIKLILYAIKKLTVSKYKVLICDNGSRQKDILKLAEIAKINECVEIIYRQQRESGSIAHGEALDILIGLVHSKYTVIMDSDCTFLMNGWDEEMISQVNGDVKIIGATSPISRAGGREAGGDFPLPFAVLFETAVFRELKICCTPANKNIGQDTGWEWREKFKEAGYKGKTFISTSTRDYKKGYFRDIIGVEEYYTDDMRLIASHFGRGSSLGEAKYFKWLNIPIISQVIRKSYGKIEKRRWINKCNQLIDSFS
jgi:hypothetical protein